MLFRPSITCSSLLAAVAVAGVLGAASPTVSAADVVVRVAPPPLRAEVVPDPRPGYVWSPGYWRWNGRDHVWTSAHWERARPGYVYRRPEWVEHDGRWAFRRGGWDRDGDGVPDRFDARPNNPYRH